MRCFWSGKGSEEPECAWLVVATTGPSRDRGWCSGQAEMVLGRGCGFGEGGTREIYAAYRLGKRSHVLSQVKGRRGDHFQPADKYKNIPNKYSYKVTYEY